MKLKLVYLLFLLLVNGDVHSEVKIDFENVPLYTYFDAEGSKQLPAYIAKETDDSQIGELNIQYLGGDWLKRNAKITVDPQDPTNKVLKFTVNEANCCNDQKGRIQLNAYDLENSKQIEYQVDMYLPEEMRLLTEYPGELNFFTISEWWNNNGWSAEYPFRISVNIVKKDSSKGSPLVFEVRSQIKREELDSKWQGNIWHEKNESVQIPFGKWFTLKYAMKEGDKETGHFSLKLVDDQKVEHTVFDVTNWTHHPDNPNPDGLSNLNPIKLYTSYRFINYMVYRQKYIQVYWDNLIFTKI
ncbi:hypothetical protein [Alteromonas sp. 14N.309.X.WAT.G.H12]|uniref:hypothetical protein n=1 Tax=Alteromonas sp. 14N.309.X.WAT.G.H12 TaxID=3120824 RepID=UPI002FD68B5E